jgi:DNA-directed RNA polymerase subunit H (RpoH/RPB5)
MKNVIVHEKEFSGWLEKLQIKKGDRPKIMSKASPRPTS